MAKENKLSKDSLNQIIQSLIVIALGIAFCFSLAVQVLSYVLGAALIVSGIVLLIITCVTNKIALTVQGLLGGLAITLGIVCIVSQVVSLVVVTVPYLLIVAGSLVILDAFLRLLAVKKIGPFAFTMLLILGSAAIALGICFLTIADFSKYAGIALGAGLIIYGLVTLISAFIKPKKSAESK